MLTIRKRDFNYTNGRDRIEGELKSTDTKPTIYANGSILMEMDTGKFFVYDESGSTWIEQ